jgi:hypothetical protein
MPGRSADEIQPACVDVRECCAEAGSIPVVTHGRATRAMLASEALVNASSFSLADRSKIACGNAEALFRLT